MVLEDLQSQLGHTGSQNLHEAESNGYWWPSLAKDILDFCFTCPVCGGFKGTYSHKIAPLIPLPPNTPGECVDTETIGPLLVTELGNTTHGKPKC